MLAYSATTVLLGLRRDENRAAAEASQDALVVGVGLFEGACHFRRLDLDLDLEESLLHEASLHCVLGEFRGVVRVHVGAAVQRVRCIQNLSGVLILLVPLYNRY